MKKHIFNIFLLALVLASCSKENPHYTELVLSEQEVAVDVDATVAIEVLAGNGNYVIKSKDDKIATAQVIGSQIEIQGISAGKTSLILTDWAKKSTTLEVLVNYIPTDELILNKTSASVDEGGFTSFSVFQGNGNSHMDYTIESSDEGVAIVAEVLDDSFKVQGVSVGEATFTITDKKGLTTTFTLKVQPILHDLVLDVEDILYFYYEDGDAVINILDGNGGYTYDIYEYSGITVTIDGNKVILNGTKEIATELIITDDRGQSKTIKIICFANLLSNTQSRVFYNGKFTARKFCKATTDTETTGRTTVKASSNSSLNRGEVLSFSGNVSVGKKFAPEFYEVGFLGRITEYEVSDLEVIKVQGKTAWITFKCEGEPAYMVVNL